MARPPAFEFAAGSSRPSTTYLQAVDLVDGASSSSSGRSASRRAGGPWRELVARLRCLRGRRHADRARRSWPRSATSPASDRPASSWPSSGLCPRSTPPARHRRQGSITKVGNGHVRRLLVESAWHARRRPTVGYELAPPPARPGPASWSSAPGAARQRLYQRWQRMAARGKPLPEDRRRLRPRALPVSSGRSRPSNRSGGLSLPQDLSTSSSGCARPHGEPSQALCGARIAGDPRP